MKKSVSLALLASTFLGGPAFGQFIPTTQQSGPDVAVSGVCGPGGGTDISESGLVSAMHSYSYSSTSCNIGDERINWFSGSSGGVHNDHPLIGQNMFRVHDGRIVQLGYSFLKHSFFALSTPGCVSWSCQGTGGSELGIGCSDTYGSGLNDGNGGGSKRDVNAATGFHGIKTNPTGGSSTHRGRLQVEPTMLGVSGARYYAEIQYVSEEDQMAGLARNNASYHEISTTNASNLQKIGGLRPLNPGIYAWQDVDSNVDVVDVASMNEGGPGVHGWYFVACNATDIGNGLWRYEYAVQNLTSDQSARSFQVPNPCGAVISDVYFHDVTHHSGDPYSNTDWSFTTSGGFARWQTESFAQNINANALRWGTLYNFGFTANSAPGAATADIGLFKPGANNTIGAAVKAPCGGPVNPTCGVQNYCTSNPTSVSAGATISSSGSASFASNDLTVRCDGAATSEFALFYFGTSQISVPFGDGVRCAGGNTFRLNPPVLTDLFGSAARSVNYGGAPFNFPGAAAAPGSTHNYQCWFRDPGGPGGSGFNLSDGLEVTYCP